MTRPTTICVHAFAGGISVGLRERCDVVGHLETSSYGVATAQLNHPGLQVLVDKRGAWAVDHLRGRVDVVAGNPECAAWSNAGSRSVAPARDFSRGYDPADARVAHFLQLFGLLDRLRPRILVIESVTQILTKGWPFVAELIQQAAALGWGCDVVALDAFDCGVPQHRRRAFLAFTALEIDWRYPAEPGPVDVREAWDGLADPAPVVAPHDAFLDECARLAGPGDKLRPIYERLHGTALMGAVRPGQCQGRPSFLYRKLDLDAPCPTVLGEAHLFHPWLLRLLSVREQQVLCGWPAAHEFVGGVRSRYAQIAQGVMPPVARWLGDQLADALAAVRPRADLNSRRHDFIAPAVVSHV